MGLLRRELLQPVSPSPWWVVDLKPREWDLVVKYRERLTYISCRKHTSSRGLRQGSWGE